MAESLNVVALISGGKDSFFSILHCIRNGHKVVALANLYPAAAPPSAHEGDETEEDLNSFMFQTVGHAVIPLYEQALGIPLYRQQIIGSAVQTGTSYSHPHASFPQLGDAALLDETESLVPLLKNIMTEHPSANAVSTGAILSTYQRTRVESVALRLGLIPLSYLWKYPILPPGTQTSLLEDMRVVGMEARIVKVASGGLDESFLWENVASGNAVRRIERATGRFGVDGDGAVLGEGGEFETLVVDGPRCLFKERIEVKEGDWRVVREGGGSAWLRILNAKSVVKAPDATTQEDCRIPELLDGRFEDILGVLQSETLSDGVTGAETLPISIPPYDLLSNLSVPEPRQGDVLFWTITSKHIDQDISGEAQEVITELRQRLSQLSLQASDIISSTIVLRSMQDFQAVNQVYGALFTQPNPPARVTISCGSAMPRSINIIIHLKVSSTPLLRKALHVQSRSYWAPANIGPYSQAICTSHNLFSETEESTSVIHVAGQIPLIPATMLLPPLSPTPFQTFNTQAVLALQHLFRIGSEMNIYWWSSVVAFLPRAPSASATHAVLAARAWELAHHRPSPSSDDDEGDVDAVPYLWEQKHHAGAGNTARHATRAEESKLPDWNRVRGAESAPPFFAVEVEELPRGSGIEWHAHLGIAGGAGGVEVEIVEREGLVVYRSEVGGRMHVVVMIAYRDEARVEAILAETGMVLGTVDWYASYWDVSLQGAGDLMGLIPCRKVWDGSGRRLAGVLLFDVPLSAVKR